MSDNKGLVKVLDIETSSLLSEMLDYSSFPYKLKADAKLHVVVIRDAYTDELFVAEGSNITKEWMKEALKGCKYLVQHNGVKFDLICLKLFGVLDYSVGYLDEPDTLFGEEVKIVDTLILSRLFNPDRFGNHSLESWGERTGCAKMDFRGELIKRGIIPKDSPKGFEFKNYTPLMTEYCILDTEVSKRTFFALMEEKGDYKGWDRAIKMEHKLADLAIRRESLGFWFDKDLAIKCVEDLTQKMEELQNKVNPILPPKPMTKTELGNFTPPNTQFLKSGKPSTHIVKFAERIGAKILENQDEKYFIEFESKTYELPFNLPLKTHIPADISNLDHVKMTLIDKYNWIPTEWSIRDFTKDSKKTSLPYEKRITAFKRWLKETEEGKYKKLRLEIAFKDNKVKDIDSLVEKITERLQGEFPVRLPTSPKIRCGVEKELCPNLTKLGEQVEFAKDFALFLTYKHRKSCIAGGEIEDMDFETEEPLSGYLSMYREIDGRIPTPAIEIGASCVVRDSELITFGGLKKIVDIKVGDEVLTHEGVYEKVTDLINNGIKPVYKIELMNGLSLTCTDNHPFMTKEDGWVRLKDLDIDRHSVLFYGEIEKWGVHNEFPNYSISSWGRILNKYGKEIKHLVQNKDLSVVVDLYNGKGVKHRRNVGKIVCEVFKGKCPDKLEVRHLDGNPFNNNIQNLEFGTSKQNSEDAIKHRYRMKKRRATVELISDEEVLRIRDYFNKNEYKKGDDEKFSLKYGVSRKYFNEIRRGVRRVISESYKEVYESEKIKAITSLGEQPTYDITVNKDHSYVVNGIVTHNTNRYRHIGVANVARASSIYGKEMRSLFGCGKNFVQMGFDFSSLEARVQGHYVKKYPFGAELAESLVAEKPNDIHSVNSRKLNIDRGTVKSVTYAILYGCSPKKLEDMLGYDSNKAKQFYDDYWDAVPALRDLKKAVEKFWEENGKSYVPGIDGRKLNTRSKHSLINLLFQSCGVIAAKYVTVILMQNMEKSFYCTNPFEGKPDVCSMIEYHDENQLLTSPKFYNFKIFEQENEAQEFVKNWDSSKGQLSAIGHSEKGYYVALPNKVSQGIQDAITETEKLLNLSVNLGFEWITGRNWFQCH